jgi:hypothetical protein
MTQICASRSATPGRTDLRQNGGSRLIPSASPGDVCMVQPWLRKPAPSPALVLCADEGKAVVFREVREVLCVESCQRQVVS